MDEMRDRAERITSLTAAKWRKLGAPLSVLHDLLTAAFPDEWSGDWKANKVWHAAVARTIRHEVEDGGYRRAG